MNQQLTDKIYCLVINNGAEIWLNEQQQQWFNKILLSITGSKYIEFEGEMINTAYIVGIFKAETMRTKERSKRGEWQCSFNYWHERDQKCGHGL